MVLQSLSHHSSVRSSKDLEPMFYLEASDPLSPRKDMDQGGSGIPISDQVQVNTLPPSIGKGNYGTIEEFRSLVKAGRSKEAKIFVRDNDWPLTHATRRHLWLDLCQLQTQEKILVDNFYWDIVKQMFGQSCLWLAYKRKPGALTSQYLKDLVEGVDMDAGSQHLPAFIYQNTLKNYHLSPNGIKMANRVLNVVAYSFPAITFSPTIYPITCLLLHYLSEEDCYNCLCALLSWKQGKFVIQTKSMYEVTWRTVLHLTKKFAKSAFGNLNKYSKGTDTLEHIFEQWLEWIFKHLPFTHLVRVMDCFFYEGIKVLYRVAMAILILFQKFSGKSDSVWSREAASNGISTTLVKFCQEIPVTPEKLLKTAFGIRALSQSEVVRIFIRTEMGVNSRSLTRNTSHNALVRSRSSEGIPTSESQVAIQTVSHTLTIHESGGVSRAHSMGLFTFDNFTSFILSNENLLILWGWLPTRITMYQPQLVYTTEEHGCSLTTFYSRVENYEPTLLIIKTTTNEIFGAYCSAYWGGRKAKDDFGQRHTYFGTGETFLFSISPQTLKYPWVGMKQDGGDGHVLHSAELFMAGDNHMITIGGGNGQGILLDEDIRFGRTEPCDTFNNPPLCSTRDFECKVVEVFAFA